VEQGTDSADGDSFEIELVDEPAVMKLPRREIPSEGAPRKAVLRSPIYSSVRGGERFHLPKEITAKKLGPIVKPEIKSMPVAKALTSQQRSATENLDIDISRISGQRGAAGKYYNVSELKDFLKRLGIPVSNSKKEHLASKLLDHLKVNP
jgi:hypothetical protein